MQPSLVGVFGLLSIYLSLVAAHPISLDLKLHITNVKSRLSETADLHHEADLHESLLLDGQDGVQQTTILNPDDLDTFLTGTEESENDPSTPSPPWKVEGSGPWSGVD